jgi:nicotinate-nucleotide adenylyltransferase
MKKVGLFGGSFDPIHKAHIEIAKIALEQLQLDEIQFIPTLNNPWKETSGANQIDRLAMMQEAIGNEKHMSINTIELEMPENKKNYTYDTLKQLKKRYPDIEYTYIMGMDQANLFSEWKNAYEMSQMVQLVAFQRGGYEANRDVLEQYHFLLLKNEPVYASSSDVRNGHIEMLTPAVLKYITKHGLYLETIVSCRMKEKRWKHTCSVANLAAKIAKANHLNDRQAYIAGMFHDIAKEMDEQEALLIMQQHYPQYLDKPFAIWHQWVSRYVSEHEYLIDDSVILEAIEHHTTGSIHMSPVGKCVYVADKLDPLRGYDSSHQIEVCMSDIHQGFRDSLIDFYDFSTKKNRPIDDCFFEIYDYFVIKGEI